MGGDAGIDQRSRRDTSSGVAVLSLRSIQTRRVRNGSEQPSIRQEPSRSQPNLGSARPRSGLGDGSIRWILGAGYQRNARKQSERGIPPNVIVSLRGTTRQRTVAVEIQICRIAPHWERLMATLKCVDRIGHFGRHGVPATITVCQKSRPKNATTQIRRIRPRVSGPKILSSWEVSPLGSLMRNYSVARQPS